MEMRKSRLRLLLQPQFVTFTFVQHQDRRQFVVFLAFTNTLLQATLRDNMTEKRCFTYLFLKKESNRFGNLLIQTQIKKIIHIQFAIKFKNNGDLYLALDQVEYTKN